MRGVSVVFYPSLIDNKRSQIKKKLESIFEKYNISKASQESIEEMEKALSKKTFTPDGKALSLLILYFSLTNLQSLNSFNNVDRKIRHGK